MSQKHLQQWRAWREDYRSSRPAVTCENCDTHYPRGVDEGNATYHGYRLVECGNCKRKAAIRKARNNVALKLWRHINKHRNDNRTVYRDVACRYIRRFEGKTYALQTDVDACEIYLENAEGRIIGRVSMLDKYPKPPPAETFDDMPF